MMYPVYRIVSYHWERKGQKEWEKGIVTLYKPTPLNPSDQKKQQVTAVQKTQHADHLITIQIECGNADEKKRRQKGTGAKDVRGTYRNLQA